MTRSLVDLDNSPSAINPAMSFAYTPSIFHEKPIWGPVVKSFFHSEEKEKQERVDYMTLSAEEIRSKISDLQFLLERRSEQFHEMNEMDDLIHESHCARVSYMRGLSNERIRQERREMRQQRNLRREQKREEKRKLREQKLIEKQAAREERRREREAEILRYTIEQRENIRKQARLFRQMKRDQEEQARLKEIADGWRTVSYKRTKKSSQKPKY